MIFLRPRDLFILPQFCKKAQTTDSRNFLLSPAVTFKAQKVNFDKEKRVKHFFKIWVGNSTTLHFFLCLTSTVFFSFFLTNFLHEDEFVELMMLIYMFHISFAFYVNVEYKVISKNFVFDMINPSC